MNLSARLLRKNMSTARLVGFLISNFIGLAIIIGGLQFYLDARSLWQDEDSFIKKEYLVVNKRVTAENTLGTASGFSDAEIADINAQPWVRKTGLFTAADFRVGATLRQGDRGFSTSMFLESIPDEFIDVRPADWNYDEGSAAVPLILSKDYLTLYNFGFATAAGMPQLSEGLMASLPMELTLSSESGDKTIRTPARIVGFSNRLNTILVPSSFMTEANTRLGSRRERHPSRLIIDVSSPGDVAIQPYLEEHAMEMAGDKNSSRASFLLNLITGIILSVGIVITLLSLFILLLSISLLMEKNRDKLHTLLMLGYPMKSVGAPFRHIILIATAGAYILSLGALFSLRAFYLKPLEASGATPGPVWVAPLVGLLLTLLIILCNDIAVSRRVRSAFRS